MISSFDKGREPLDEGLRRALQAVPDLKQRFEHVHLGAPLLGSRQFRDRRLPLGEHVGLTASGRLAGALDHLVTWHRYIFELQAMPVYAHLTLLRPVLEGAVQARWVLDPGEAPATRVRRAIGVVLHDLEEQRKFEETLRAAGWSPSSTYMGARERGTRITGEAVEASLAPIRLMGTTDLLQKYRQGNGHDEVAAFRATSAVLHGTASAALMAEVERTDVGATMSTLISTGSQPLAAAYTALAVSHVVAAVADLETYIEPK